VKCLAQWLLYQKVAIWTINLPILAVILDLITIHFSGS
jgi:hypothetical protein